MKIVHSAQGKIEFNVCDHHRVFETTLKSKIRPMLKITNSSLALGDLFIAPKISELMSLVNMGIW